MNKKLATAFALAFIGQAGSALASDITFNGYGSIRGGLATSDDFLPFHHRYDQEVNFKEESLFAIQAQGQLNEQWSATVILQAEGKNDFDLEARWAYLNYEMTPDTSIAFGRFAMPYFRGSDYQDIGYSHNYSRMPRSIYIRQEFDVIEGIRVVHNTLLGDGDITFKGSYGSFSGEAKNSQGSSPTDLENIIQFSAEYNYDWLSLFVGASQSDTTTHTKTEMNNAFMYQLPGYSVQNGTLYNPYNEAVYDMENIYITDEQTLYMSTGIGIDYNQWLFNAEYATYEVDADKSVFEKSNSYYVSLGYRFDRLTATVLKEGSTYDFDYNHANSADPYVNAVAKGTTDAILKPMELNALGLHLRYDAAENVAYKFEYSRIADPLSDDDTDIITFGVDFVF